MVVERRGRDVRRIEPQWKPERSFRIGKAEARRHDTDNLAVQTVDDDVLADDGRVAPELALPEALSDDGDGRRPRLAVVIGKRPSALRSDFENMKEAARCEGGGDSRG